MRELGYTYILAREALRKAVDGTAPTARLRSLVDLIQFTINEDKEVVCQENI